METRELITAIIIAICFFRACSVTEHIYKENYGQGFANAQLMEREKCSELLRMQKERLTSEVK